MQLQQALIVFAVAFIVAYAMVPVSKKLAVILGAIDYPGNRRVNTSPVPRCGGIALYLGLCAGALTIVLGVRVFGWDLASLYVMSNVDYGVLFVGISTMFAVGLIDDIVQLKSLTKFAGQIVAAVIVACSGMTIGSVRLFGAAEYIMLGWADIPLTAFYLVVFVNIVNLVDGLDGLASGLVAIVSASLLYMSLLRGAYVVALLIVALIAVCLAFLRYNFFPASIFMGDSGSHLLGLMVGIVSIGGVARAQGVITMIVPLVMAGVPVLDTLSAIVRRMRAGQPVGKGDANHIHHRLMRSGLGQRKAVAILWTCTAVLAIAGAAVEYLSGFWRLVIGVALAVAVGVVILKFGLFKPVLKHHYDNSGKSGARMPLQNGSANTGAGKHSTAPAVHASHASAAAPQDADEGGSR